MNCPACGAEAPSGARFCPNCGQDMRLRGDERRIATVVFGDLVGFTGLAETRDPEQVKMLVDNCFEQLVEIIESFGGRVDKIIGDALVALFGAPVAHEDDAERAVRAALRMQESLRDQRAVLSDQVEMRIGVNTGEVLVGALRSGGDYTAMGDVVNTASRLQTAAEPGQVLVGPETHQATRDVVSYDECAPIRVKGKAEPLACWIATGALAPPGHRPNRPRVPLVGREHELQLLTGAIAATVEHERASMLLVTGEAGVGKSRLAAEVAAWAECEVDAFVLEGRCVPYGEANVWWPVAEALRQSCGLEVGDDEETARTATESAVRTALGDDAPDAEVGRVIAGLMHLMGFEGALQGIDAARDRDEAIRALVSFADGYSRTRPVLVVLSDLHWADPQVLDLLDTLLSRLDHRRYTILATARGSLTETWSPGIGHHSLVVLHLDPLSRDAATRLVVELGAGEIDDELAAMLLDRAGGNPFFLEELVSLLDQVGDADALPSSLRALVAARLDALPLAERWVLEDAAVLGRRGPIVALSVMAEVKRGIPDVTAEVDQLVARELLSSDGSHWDFRSDLVREVAYSTLTKADRAKSHAGIASWVEEFENNAIESVTGRIAHHYSQAAEMVREVGAVQGVPDDVEQRARTWLVKAAERAEQNDLGVTMAELYGQALRFGAGDDGEDRRLRLGQARGLIMHSDLGDARGLLNELRAEAEAAGDDEVLALALKDLGDVELRSGQSDLALRHLGVAVSIAERLGDERTAAEVTRLQGMVHVLDNDYTEADRYLVDALERFQRLGDRKGEAWALQNLSWSAFIAGRAAEADTRLRQAVDTFTELGDAGGLGWAMGLLAWVRFHLGSPAEAEQLAEGVMRSGLERGDRWGAGMMQVLLASIRLWTGRTEAAVASGEGAVAIFSDISDAYGQFQALGTLGRAQVTLGLVDEARATFDQLRSEVDPSGLGSGWSVPELLSAVQVGDLAWAEEAAALAPKSPINLEEIGGTDHIVALTLLALQQGDVELAGDWLVRADDSAERKGGFVSAARALVAAAAGRADAADAECRALAEDPRATYLDRAFAGIGHGLAVGGRAGRTVLGDVRSDVDETGDRVAQLIVRMADSLLATALGDDDAVELVAEVARRQDGLGVAADGWSRVFELAQQSAGEAVG